MRCCYSHLAVRLTVLKWGEGCGRGVSEIIEQKKCNFVCQRREELFLKGVGYVPSLFLGENQARSVTTYVYCYFRTVIGVDASSLYANLC